MNLKLPAKWDGKDGVYKLIIEPGIVRIENISTTNKVAIPALDLPRFDDESELYIKDNYSESRATIRSKTDIAHGGVLWSRYLPEFIAKPFLFVPAPPRMALSRNRTLRLLEDVPVTTLRTDLFDTKELKNTPGEASVEFQHLEKDTVASPPANALSSGVGSSSVTEEADKETDGKDKAEEEEKDSRPEETESPGNQSDKVDQGEAQFDDSCQVPPPPVGGFLRQLRTGAAAGGARRRGLGIAGLSGSRARAGSGSG